jgi:chromosome segregation ATPase
MEFKPSAVEIYGGVDECKREYNRIKRQAEAAKNAFQWAQADLEKVTGDFYAKRYEVLTWNPSDEAKQALKAIKEKLDKLTTETDNAYTRQNRAIQNLARWESYNLASSE